MSTDRQKDAGMDRLLRAALEPDAPVSGEVCPGADTVAAYAEGGLTERERFELEPHLAACARCQSVLAVMARDAVADAVTTPAQVPAWRAWLLAPWLRWLVPASAAAIALLLYVAVKPDPATDEARSSASAAAPAPAPEGTMAKRSDQAVSQRAEKTTPVQADAQAAPGTPAARENATVPPVIASPPFLPAPVSPAAAPILAGVPPAPSTVAGSTLAEAVPPPDALGASARTATANRSAIAVAETRTRRDVIADSAGGAAPAPGKSQAPGKRIVTVDVDHAATRYDLESLWKEAEFVVRARAAAPHPAVLVRRQVAPNVEAVEPFVSTEFDVVEVFKRLDSVIPAPQFVMVQTGSEAEDDATIYRVPDHNWIRIASGTEYVLFLRRSGHPAIPEAVTPFAGPRGVYRLQGDVVVIGNGDARVTSPSTSDLLAQLHQLAGTARR